jgi:hypothetical protein
MSVLSYEAQLSTPLTLAFVLSLKISTTAASPHAAPAACSSPAEAAYALAKVQEMVSAPGREADQMRQRLHIPAAPLDSVVLVTDEWVCERAARAYYRHELGPTSAQRAAVIRVRDRYIVSGTIRAGEWSIASVYSLRFESIANILM